MINNNPYNIPQKKPLSQSKILSQTNSSRNSSTYSSNRSNNQIMYNSSIFMNNSTIISPNYDQTFYEPIRQPLSPHSRFTKPKQAHFSISSNINTLKPSDSSCFSSYNLKQNINQKSLFQLRQRMELIERRFEMQQRAQISLKQIQKMKQQNPFQRQVFRSKSVQTLRNDDVFSNWINQIINNRLKITNQEIWKRIQQMNQQILSQKDFQIQRIKEIEQLKRRTQQMMGFHEQIVLKIKRIQKTVVQMGEDIHLINDKEENLKQKIQKQFNSLNIQIKQIKISQKELLEEKKQIMHKNILKNDISQSITQIFTKLNEMERKLQIKFDRIEQIQMKVKSLENLENKINQIQHKINVNYKDYTNLKPCFQLKYKLQPYVVKFMQKMQIFTYSKNIKSGQIVFNQITYFLDNQGYLLDNDRNYLVNGDGKQKIRLNEKHLLVLKNNNILI